MNIAMQLTVDQLVRSLRGLAHGVADRIEVRAPKRAVRPKLADQKTMDRRASPSEGSRR